MKTNSTSSRRLLLRRKHAAIFLDDSDALALEKEFPHWFTTAIAVADCDVRQLDGSTRMPLPRNLI